MSCPSEQRNLDSARSCFGVGRERCIKLYISFGTVIWRYYTDAFFTHHGMNSTHEAIFHRVPMVSYPFFWDQPGLAHKCQSFGLAIPLTDTLRGGIDKRDVRRIMTRLADARESMMAALSRARGWEEAVIANRPAVLRKVMDLMR